MKIILANPRGFCAGVSRAVEVVEKVANAIPHAQFEIIKGSGHLPNMEKPKEFNELMTKFYEGV